MFTRNDTILDLNNLTEILNNVYRYLINNNFLLLILLLVISFLYLIFLLKFIIYKKKTHQFKIYLIFSFLIFVIFIYTILTDNLSIKDIEDRQNISFVFRNTNVYSVFLFYFLIYISSKNK